MSAKFSQYGVSAAAAGAASLLLGAPAPTLASAETVNPSTPPKSCQSVLALARIVKISPENADVTIVKRGARAPVRASSNECLDAGERVSVRNGTVTLETPAGRRIIGRYQDSSEYAAPDIAVPDVPRGPLAAIQSAFDRLTSSSRRGEPGGARGDGNCAADDPKTPPIGPVPGLPAGDQRVGSDIATLRLAWDATGGAKAVRIVVRDAKRNVIAERLACEEPQYRFDLDAALRKPGTELIVEAGSTLTWRVHVVDPASLPQPAEALPASWLLGAWRLERGTPDTRLDAVSRLATGEKDFLGAHLLLGSALAPK